MAVNFRRFSDGIQLVPKTTSTASIAGEIDFDTTSNKLNLFNGSISDHIVTETVVGTITNKILAVGSNHITSTINTAAQFNLTTGDLESSVVTTVELGYVSGVTSSIQTQLNSISGSAITDLTGDVTATGPGSVAATLATVNTNVGSFGSSTSIPSFTVNGKGLITAASGNVVIAPAGTLSGTTLNSTVVTSSLTTVGTIGTGTWNGTTIAIANGGTGQTSANAGFNALSPMTTSGDIIYGGASGAGTRLGKSTDGSFLTLTSGIPAWTSVSPGSPIIPTIQRFTSGSGTYTTPTSPSPLYIKVSMVGGGGGGGSDAGGGPGANGTSTTFSNWTCGGGLGAAGGNIGSQGGGGGSVTTGTGTVLVSIAGSGGGTGAKVSDGGPGSGGTSPFGGAGSGGGSGVAGQNAVANSGSGGGGNGFESGVSAANGGGGAGGYQQFIITSLSSTYSYGIGSGGAGGTGTTLNGGNGGSGIIIVEEFYQ